MATELSEAAQGSTRTRWPLLAPLDLVGIAPIAFSLMVLPLLFGGAYRGWLALAQALTFLSVGTLVAAGRIVLRQGRLLGRVKWVLASSTVFAAVSTLFSRELGTSVAGLLEWLWLGASALLTAHLGCRKRGRDLLAAMLLAAVLVEALWGYYLWWGSQDPKHAQVGTFYASNQYAGYLLLLAPLCLALCLTASSRIKAAGAGFLASFLYLGVALSGSRAGVVAAGVGLLATTALVARGSPGRAVGRAALVAVGVMGLGVILTGPLLFPSTKGATGVGGAIGVKGADPTDLKQRLQWDAGALTIGLQRPLTGSGLGTFGDAFFTIQKPRWQWSRWAHNQYLEAFAEGGFPLAAAVIALPLVALGGGLSTLRRRRLGDAHFAQLGLWGGLAGGAAHLLIDHDWSYPAYAVAFVVMAVLLLVPWEVSEDPRGETSGSVTAGTHLGKASRVGLVALCAVCLAAVGGQYASSRLQQGRSGTNVRNLHLAMLLAPYSPGPIERLALLRAESGGSRNLQDAAGHFRSAIDRNRLDPHLWWELAGVEQKLGNVPAARSAYRAAIDTVPLAAPAYLLAAEFEATSAHDPVLAASILDQGLAKIRFVPPIGGESPGLQSLVDARARLER